MAKCQKCGSKDIELLSYLGITVVKCGNCGFDERIAYDVYPEQKTSQKAKGNYSVYKTGGSQRARKK